MSATEVPVRVGDTLAGKYRVEKVLGAGAMGIVVAATHVDLREVRAIKFMLPSMLGDVEGVERFLREARAAVRLKSQHVAKVHDVGRLETGAPYIVMEYLEGTDLKSLLGARGTLPVTEAVAYMLQACEAIAEAHALGIVHRDLKPANIFLTTGVGGVPCVKVLDFGIAKILVDDGPAVDVTRTTQFLGTPLYMSPEQMRSTRNVDARTDIWALGVLLYRMLAGRTPFEGSTVTEICVAVGFDQPEPLITLRPDVPPGLDAAVMRCLEKKPAGRFATAAELAAAVAPFADVAASPLVSRSSPGLRVPSLPDVAPAAPGASTAQPSPAPRAAAAQLPPLAPQGATIPSAAPPTIRPAPVPGLPAPAARGKIALAAGAAALVSAGLLLGGLHAAGVLDGPQPIASRQAGSPAVPAVGKLAGLDNKQIRGRIEAAHYKIVLADERVPTTTWTLAGAGAPYVQMFRLDDPRSVEMIEQTLLKQPGATLRDGTCILHVHMAEPGSARALLAQISR
jgi:serine/threonine-protein kinase